MVAPILAQVGTMIRAHSRKSLFTHAAAPGEHNAQSSASPSHTGADRPRAVPGEQGSLELQLPPKIEMMTRRFEALQVDTDNELALSIASKLTSASFDAFGSGGSRGQQSSEMLNVCMNSGDVVTVPSPEQDGIDAMRSSV